MIQDGIHVHITNCFIKQSVMIVSEHFGLDLLWKNISHIIISSSTQTASTKDHASCGQSKLEQWKLDASMSFYVYEMQEKKY